MPMCRFLESDYAARNTLFAIRPPCRSRAKLRGRKTIFLVSEGYAMTSLVRSALDRAIDAANMVNFSIYTMNPGGPEQRERTDATATVNDARSSTLA